MMRPTDLPPGNGHGRMALVTGGAGFIGSHLAEALLATGYRVRVLDDLSTGRRDNLPSRQSDDFEFWEGSIADRDFLIQAMSGVDLVFHLAAMVAVPESIDNPRRCLELNDLAVFNLYEAAAAAGVGRIIYSSSSAVYGDQSVPHHEDICPRPDTPYAMHKLLGEHYGLFFHQHRHLESVYLRYFNVYGPRQLPDSPYSGVISLFFNQLGRGEPVTIFDDGWQSRDFVYVADVVRANLSAAVQPGVSGLTFNIGSGQVTAIIDLYNHLAALAGRSGLAPRFASPRPGDIRHSSGPVDRANRLLGFQAEISLADGLARTWEWFVAAALQGGAVNFGENI